MIEQKLRLRRQTNAFAMQSGMIFGAIWSISFLLLVSGIAGLTALFPIIFFLTPFIGFYFARKFRKDVQNDGEVGYLRGFWFSLQLYLYATAILAIVVYVYLTFFDNGALVQSYLEKLSIPEIRAAIQAQGIQIKEMEEMVRNLNAMNITASIINLNALLAIPMALPTAFFAMTRKNTH